MKEIPQSQIKKVFAGALKAISYLTIIMPLIMFGLKIALRSNKTFRVVKILTPTPAQKGDLFVFGDVHGELVGFQENLSQAGLIDSSKNWKAGSAIGVQMGDVLDRGPLSKASYEYLATLQQQASAAGGAFIRLLGNHELMFLQNNYQFATISHPEEMAAQIKEDIKNRNVQLAYTDGTRLYLHAGLRSEIRELVIKEITQQKSRPIGPVSLQEIANYLNQLLITAVKNNNFSHKVFAVGQSRGGEEPVGGPLWEDISGMLKSMHARDIPQIIAHNPPHEEGHFIRMTDSMGLINVDAGLCKTYGGHNAYLKISRGRVSIFEKVKGIWKEFQNPDKVHKKTKELPAQQTGINADAAALFKSLGYKIEEAPTEGLLRKYPPISMVDTICIRNHQISSVHGRIKIFSDKEILEICPLSGEEIVDTIPIQYTTKNHKAVIQQQATRGCTAAAATMLIVDHGGKPDCSYLQGTNIGDEKSMGQALEKAGLKTLVTSVPNNLRSLREAIIRNGPAIVQVDTGGGHVVVVDEISENHKKITLRDPYHGWAIVVSEQGFKKALDKFSTIQIIQISTS